MIQLVLNRSGRAAAAVAVALLILAPTVALAGPGK